MRARRDANLVQPLRRGKARNRESQPRRHLGRWSHSSIDARARRRTRVGRRPGDDPHAAALDPRAASRRRGSLRRAASKLGHHNIGGLGFYSGARVMPLGDELDVTRFLARHPGSMVLVHEEVAESLFARDRDRWAPRVSAEG